MVVLKFLPANIPLGGIVPCGLVEDRNVARSQLGLL